MSKIDKLVDQMRQNPEGTKFNDLKKVCDHYFEEPRNKATSHYTYKMPWAGDPRVNIQAQKNMAKTYQVRQVLKAIDKLKEEQQ